MSVTQDYTLIVQWSEEDQLYLAYSPELPGCITHGRTYVEAVEMGVEAMELWCDVTQAAGEALPAPQHYSHARTALPVSTRAVRPLVRARTTAPTGKALRDVSARPGLLHKRGGATGVRIKGTRPRDTT